MNTDNNDDVYDFDISNDDMDISRSLGKGNTNTY